jgi:hypothetical protein
MINIHLKGSFNCCQAVLASIGENIGDGPAQSAPCACDHGNFARQVRLI